MSLMAALAAGCSSDDIVDDGGKKPGTDPNGKAYVALNIMMPNTNGNRAGENFDAGVPGEYKVNDVTVTYFASADGTNPKFTRTYNAEELGITVTGTNDITSKVTLPVEVVPFSGTAYALVEINNPGITVNAANNKEVENITDVAYFTGNSKDDFFMTNTVMKDGTYLAQVTTSDTKDAAIANAPNNAIYVERAVGKVNLCVATETGWGTTAGKEKTYTIQSGVNANATVEISAWKLDITNKKMFPIRKFAGTSNTDWNQSDFGRLYGSAEYRTYWAQDPNYDNYDPLTPGNGSAENFKFITSDSEITNSVGVWGSASILPGNEYCLENTFDTKHQKQDETTRVLVKAVYTPAKVGFSTGNDWFSLASSTEPYTETEIKNMIKTALNTTDDVTLNFTSTGKKEKITTSSFTVGSNATSDADVSKVVAAIGETISYYKGGVCYYPIRIKHFGDVCPWTYDNYLDGSKEKEYLGRYGVVRNNWYQIRIKSISQPGSPEIPTPSTDQDDVKDNYLDAQINILDWAVRNQDVIL